jgi:uncharacterized C2H2 Zn-finger protein
MSDKQPPDINTCLKVAEALGKSAFEAAGVVDVATDKVIACPKCKTVFYNWEERSILGCPNCSQLIRIRKNLT